MCGAGRGTVVVVLRVLKRERRRQQLVEQRLDHLHQRQVDVGRFGVRQTVDFQQRRHAGSDLLPDRGRRPGQPVRAERSVARRGDAIEFAPLGIEGPPQVEMPGRRPPHRGKFDRPGALVGVEIGRPRAVGVVAGVAPPRIRADLQRRQLPDIADPDGDRRRLRDLVEQMVRKLPRLIDEQDVERRTASCAGPRCSPSRFSSPIAPSLCEVEMTTWRRPGYPPR